jgi:hypothetical protein
MELCPVQNDAWLNFSAYLLTCYSLQLLMYNVCCLHRHTPWTILLIHTTHTQNQYLMVEVILGILMVLQIRICLLCTNTVIMVCQLKIVRMACSLRAVQMMILKWRSDLLTLLFYGDSIITTLENWHGLRQPEQQDVLDWVPLICLHLQKRLWHDLAHDLALCQVQSYVTLPPKPEIIVIISGRLNSNYCSA